MVEWLNAMLPGPNDAPTVELAAKIGRAAVLGVVVALVHFLTQRRGRAETAPFVATLVLLTALIAMVTVVIGESVARAFGLAGALSIIRFRTVVDDTRDTAFVIFAVVVGMAVGSGFLAVAMTGVPIVAGLALLLSLWGRWPGGSRAATLVVRLAAGSDPDAVVAGVVQKHTRESRLVAVSMAKQGAAMDVTYSVRLRDPRGTLALLGELQRLEGVLGVEWKEPDRGDR